MRFSQADHWSPKKNIQVMVLPIWEEGRPLARIPEIEKDVMRQLKAAHFKGTLGEMQLCFSSEGAVFALGLGEKEKITADRLREAFAKACLGCRAAKFKSIALFAANLKDLDAVFEGLLFRNYVFERFKRDKKPLIDAVHVVGGGSHAKEHFERVSALMEGVYLTRDLINDNADHVTPTYLATVAKKLGKEAKTKTKILGRKAIEKEKMGLFLAVNQGSALEPQLITIEYRGDSKSKDHTVLVGKGVTYDTGGLSLKPSTGMDTMKADMSGSAAVLGTLRAAQALGLKKNITVVIASTDNAIGSRSYRPGDVFKGMSGKTVEVMNTDAEGRLTLADALTYAQKYLKPSRIVDVATLTGACVVGLGEGVCGLMSNDKEVESALVKASDKSGERAWPLPLPPEYRQILDSPIADMRNVGVRWGGAITAGIFLQEFVDEGMSWAHLDIAGPAFPDQAFRYFPKGATGFGVRLLIEFLQTV